MSVRSSGGRVAKKRDCHCGFGGEDGLSCMVVEGERDLRQRWRNLVALRSKELGLGRVSCMTERRSGARLVNFRVAYGGRHFL